MSISGRLKIQAMRLEKQFCMWFGVAAYRRIRGITSRSASADSAIDEVLLVADLLLSGKRDGLMVDVGAHHGESFRFFAFSGWDVLAFEPDPAPEKHAMILARSTSRVNVLRYAVSEKSGEELAFYVSNESSGVSSLTPFLGSHTAAPGTVHTERLDNVLKSVARGRKVDFLKIDTEGHDLFALRSIDWSQECQRPRVVLCEFENKKTKPLGYECSDLGGFLLAQGYSVWMSEWFPIEKYGGRHRWRSMKRWPCDCADQNGWGNFLAVEPALSKEAAESWASIEAGSTGTALRPKP